MQLYAGQEDGKPEMQIVKVNIRGTGFRHDEPRQLCALAVAAVGGQHPQPVPSAFQSREHLRFVRSGSACAETAKSERIESARRFICLMGHLRVSGIIALFVS
jgi:hypothetical protein